MKIFKRIVVTIIIIILVAIISFVAIFIYEDQFKKREVYRENSPYNGYEFVVYQVGSPSWPFGPVKAEIKVINSAGKTIDKESISIHNDGAGIYKHNIKNIVWHDTKLEVECTGTTEHSTAIYTLEFE